MKKIILFILSIIVAFSLVACNTGKKTLLSNSNNGDMPESEELKTDDQTEDIAFDYTGNYIDDHLKGDYSISYKMVSSEQGEENSSYIVKMMRTNQGYYAMMGEDTEILYILNGDTYDMYMGDSENGFEQYSGISLTEDEVKSQAQAFLGYMSAYSQWGDSLEKGGSITVAGRSCVQYAYEYDVLGTKVKAEYCIDKETGVCMKYFIEGSVGDEGGSYQFECTEFKTSGVTLPKYN